MMIEMAKFTKMSQKNVKILKFSKYEKMAKSENVWGIEENCGKEPKKLKISETSKYMGKKLILLRG